MDDSREVLVRSSGAGFKQELQVGPHHAIGDEPVDVGGEDAGPNPYELLLEALGSCTSMTIGLYARRHGWPLAGVSVRLKHRRVYAEDCAHCDKPGARLDQIDREIELTGPLTDEQRARLMKIADQCPVHKTLTSKIDIRTKQL
ncbi:MAG TPA: OsmC family protein [Polyangia bacterium]|nr:OsmC family protein [Polyangia bacterium]